MKKLRLFTVLFAAAALSGCATYDYAGGSAPGGYYYGRASSSYGGYGPYDSGYGYGYPYGYGGYSAYGYGGYYNPYYGYGGYYPYYPYRPHHPRPPRPPRPYEPEDGRAPPWRDPTNGMYRESGSVLTPPRNRVQVPNQTQMTRPRMENPVVRQRPEGDRVPRVSQPQPSAPRVERSRPVERASMPRQTRERTRDEER